MRVVVSLAVFDVGLKILAIFIQFCPLGYRCDVATQFTPIVSDLLLSDVLLILSAFSSSSRHKTLHTTQFPFASHHSHRQQKWQSLQCPVNHFFSASPPFFTTPSLLPQLPCSTSYKLSFLHSSSPPPRRRQLIARSVNA